MKNYFLIEIAEGDKTVRGYSVYGYETEKEAVATFHQKLGNAMKSTLFESDLLIITDADGKVVKREKYVA